MYIIYFIINKNLSNKIVNKLLNFSMTKVDELITKLLNEKLFKRFDNLEKRFTSEATDIASLEFSVDGLKSNFRKFNWSFIFRNFERL